MAVRMEQLLAYLPSKGSRFRLVGFLLQLLAQGAVVTLNLGQVLRIMLLALQVFLPADASGWWLPSAAGPQHQALSVL